MFQGIQKDIEAIKERDPAARTSFEVLALYPGLHAIILHRPAHWLYQRKAYFPARLLSQFSRFLTGIEIHPGAKVGRGVLIDHGSGVVIGETAEVGDNCTIYQGVTLGGTGKEAGKRHPTLGKNVLVGSGAKVLGPFKIGDGSKIASNAVVLQPIPEGSTAVGVPARVVKRNGKRVSAGQLDHVHTPDPVSQELCRLSAEVNRIKKRLDSVEEEKKTPAPVPAAASAPASAIQPTLDAAPAQGSQSTPHPVPAPAPGPAARPAPYVPNPAPRPAPHQAQAPGPAARPAPYVPNPAPRPAPHQAQAPGSAAQPAPYVPNPAPRTVPNPVPGQATTRPAPGPANHPLQNPVPRPAPPAPQPPRPGEAKHV